MAHNYAASSATASVDYVSITITYQNGVAGIGTSSTPVSQVNVNGTCQYNGQTAHSPCSFVDDVYASSISTTGQNLSVPQVDFTYWWANAKPGPKHFCTTPIRASRRASSTAMLPRPALRTTATASLFELTVGPQDG